MERKSAKERAHVTERTAYESEGELGEFGRKDRRISAETFQAWKSFRILDLISHRDVQATTFPSNILSNYRALPIGKVVVMMHWN